MDPRQLIHVLAKFAEAPVPLTAPFVEDFYARLQVHGLLVILDRLVHLAQNEVGVAQVAQMVAFQPPDIAFVPLLEAINKVRTVPADSEMMLIARTLGICLGGAQ